MRPIAQPQLFVGGAFLPRPVATRMSLPQPVLQQARAFLGAFVGTLMVPVIMTAHAQDSTPQKVPSTGGAGGGYQKVPLLRRGKGGTLHPALFLVGDSIMRTGNGTGRNGQWGWGSEIIPLFDPAKIHVYNEAHGGRKQPLLHRGGLWDKILDRLQPGDFILLQFGHNDSSNSQNYPDRTTITGMGDEIMHIGVGVSNKVVPHVRLVPPRVRQGRQGQRRDHHHLFTCPPQCVHQGQNQTRVRTTTPSGPPTPPKPAALSSSTSTPSPPTTTTPSGRRKQPHCSQTNQHTKKAGARLNAESVNRRPQAIEKTARSPMISRLLPPRPDK